MDKMASFLGDKAGDLVEGMVKKALGVEDKDKDKDRGGGGFMSMFGGDKKDDDRDKGGMFSFGDKKKDDDDDKGNFFSQILDRGDDDRKQKPSGFHGLFNEQDGQRGPGAGLSGGGPGAGLSDGDLFDDLMSVAEETSQN